MQCHKVQKIRSNQHYIWMLWLSIFLKCFAALTDGSSPREWPINPGYIHLDLPFLQILCKLEPILHYTLHPSPLNGFLLRLVSWLLTRKVICPEKKIHKAEECYMSCWPCINHGKCHYKMKRLDSYSVIAKWKFCIIRYVLKVFVKQFHLIYL